MTERAFLKTELLTLLQRGVQPLADDAFNQLALRAFQFQFEHNIPYRRYCERRGVDARSVTQWLEIPAVPTAAFKAAPLVAGDAAHAELVFRTSGTTQGVEQRGSHYVLDAELYERSVVPTFQYFVLSGFARMPMIALVPEWQQGGDSSLSYMVTAAMRELGDDGWFAVTERGIDFERLTEDLRRHEQSGQVVCLLGTSLAFLHWLGQLSAHNLRFELPRGSRIMDTGGFKGVQRSTTGAELRSQYQDLLGVPAHHVVNEYGMTEMLSQFYDAHLRAPALDAVKQGPPWVRTAVVDPETLAPLPDGEVGLLRHFDLANVFSVSALQTEDLGRAHPAGFQLLGRAPGATPRGCSIAMDMFLSAART